MAPPADVQKLVMTIIYDENQAGRREGLPGEVLPPSTAEAERRLACDAAILGCTELVRLPHLPAACPSPHLIWTPWTSWTGALKAPSPAVVPAAHGIGQGKRRAGAARAPDRPHALTPRIGRGRSAEI
ncbi:MAG: hypothetical protein ACLRWQ_18150 [Flavonifractor plautii]